jgi:hypothetical protein|tara:strand:+ start:134 stop:325 length:192 start_codon:yes stop_codon:yes gene_type:complete
MQFKAKKSDSSVEKTKATRDKVLKNKQADLDIWIDTNIQDLDDVRSYLKRLSRAVKANMKFQE